MPASLSLSEAMAKGKASKLALISSARSAHRSAALRWACPSAYANGREPKLARVLVFWKGQIRDVRGLPPSVSSLMPPETTPCQTEGWGYGSGEVAFHAYGLSLLPCTNKAQKSLLGRGEHVNRLVAADKVGAALPWRACPLPP